jgi:hypothetical protein
VLDDDELLEDDFSLGGDDVAEVEDEPEVEIELDAETRRIPGSIGVGRRAERRTRLRRAAGGARLGRVPRSTSTSTSRLPRSRPRRDSPERRLEAAGAR